MKSKFKQFWKKHRRALALVAGLIGTPLAAGVFLVGDHIATQESVKHG